MTRSPEPESAAEIEAAIMFACDTAKRLPRVSGLPHYATPYDMAHREMDRYLDMLMELMP